MIEFVKITVSLVPVFLFLAALVFLDSYKLVKLRSVLQMIFIGCVVAVACLFVHIWIIRTFFLDISVYSRYGSPIVEELLKAIFIVYLIKTNRVGFLVDSAIYGFAVGAGFSLSENIYYLHSLKDPNLLLWLIRGFGTAMMHGGTTAILAIVSKSLTERYSSSKLLAILPGFVTAILIHSFFNNFFLPPLIITITQLTALPILMTVIFIQSERILRDWLEVGMDTDVRLLEYIITGRISETNIGVYLKSLKNKFPGEILADMLCLLRMYLELAIRAKGILLMQGAGFRITPDTEIKEKFAEIEFLKKSIGKTGKLALSPILHTHTRDLWQLYLLETK